MVMDEPTRYQRRKPTSLPGQTELNVRGVRPDRGHCPVCGAPENMHCGPTCTLLDPIGDPTLFDRPRCSRCAKADPDAKGSPRVVLIAPRGTPRLHLLGQEHASACRLVRAVSALRYEGVRW